MHVASFLLIPALVAVVFSIASAVARADESYAVVAAGRAAKIVGALELADAAHAVRVREIVAAQYVALNEIHRARDARLDAIRKAAPPDAGAQRQQVADEVAARLYHLRAAFVARLAVELSPAQIDQVKDGMTYGVLPNTWRVYQEMLPDLTDEQRRQILAWLIEARELAMDGSTSQEKHGWFGKYKGRINNYLSQAGYDMKQAEKAWLQRKKE